jgi:hypothetical protein
MKKFSLMPPEQINFFSSNLIDQLNPEHGLITLAKKFPWNYLEKELSKFYHRSMGRPAKPIRLMTGLLILKQLENLSGDLGQRPLHATALWSKSISMATPM